MIKKITIIFILIFSQSFLYAKQTSAELRECSTASWYELYKCRVEKVCKIYHKEDQIIYVVKKNDDYLEAESSDELKEAKKKYRKNMNNIYKCALQKTQKKSLNTIKNKLLRGADKTWEITNKINWKIELRIKKIDLSSKKLWCKEYENEKLNDKLAVLNQTTYEICRYSSYLEYLRSHNSRLENILWWINEKELEELEKKGDKQTKEFLENKKYSISQVAKLVRQKNKEVQDEIEHSFKIFPLAYHAYSEYENNFIIHVLLELVREDFIVFRNKLHKVLSPISQVVYKLSNAMSTKN